MNVRIQLMEKSAMMEAEVKKLEERIQQDFLDKKTMVIKKEVPDFVDEIRSYC